MATTELKKQRADDYLLDFAAQSEPWFKRLLEVVIAARGVPAEELLDAIYSDFLVSQGLEDKKSDSGIETQIEPATSKGNAGNFILTALTHEKGVNVLREGATIPFHPKLTVIYGKNGSGKSGFVRILKKVAGSKTQEEIWQNIHNSKTQNDCSATLTYSDGKEHPVAWSGQSKVAPFHQISIFDGKCIPFYLNKGIDFSYQPYGFELFPALSSALQRLQRRLEVAINDAEARKPDIDNLFDSTSPIGIFAAQMDTSTKPEDIDALTEWTPETKKELAKMQKKQKDLYSIGQKAELLRTYNQRIKALEEALVHIQTDLSPQKIKSYNTLIKRFNALQKKLSTKKGKTLEDFNIPEMDSTEWQQFAEAAEDYIETSHDESYPAEGDHCIFCQQKLSKNAQKLIQLYRDFFKEEEVTDIDTLEEKINGIQEELEYSSYSESFPYSKDQYNKLLPKKVVSDAFAAMEDADTLAETLATSLEEKKTPQKIRVPKLAPLLQKIRAGQTKLSAEIAEVEALQRNLPKETREVSRAITELKDIQALSTHKKKLTGYLATEKWVAKASAAQGRLNTKPITELGNRAWKELVSNSFKGRFRTEAQSLDAPVVNLEFHGEYGSQIRQKDLAGVKEIDKFLSEGEQKAVALADFFAELNMQEQKAPVIFDDPATSFDHDRKRLIANRIVAESATNQVVVFTHDLMFASYLHRKVQSKNAEIDSDKAAFHNLESDGSEAGVITPNYYIGRTKFDAALKKIEQKAKDIEPLTGDARADALESAYSLLRQAVEKAVEEKIFGGVITRWQEQIQLLNVPRATLNGAKLAEAQQLHEEFSAYINSHDQSDEMTHHAIASLESLKTDIEKVRGLAATTETASVPVQTTPISDIL